MIEVVVALLMFWDGEIKEHRIQESMAACLRARRIAEREFNPTCLTSVYVVRQKQKYTWVKNQSKNSTSNKVAKYLRDRRYRQIVIKNKKAYDRKKDKNDYR